MIRKKNNADMKIQISNSSINNKHIESTQIALDNATLNKLNNIHKQMIKSECKKKSQNNPIKQESRLKKGEIKETQM